MPFIEICIPLISNSTSKILLSEQKELSKEQTQQGSQLTRKFQCLQGKSCILLIDSKDNKIIKLIE